MQGQAKQYQNSNYLNSKLCLIYQIKVYVCVSADTNAWATCPPSTATSVAIVIIQNLTGMFNENLTFLRKVSS
jgi:hypothetical protein